MEVLTTEHKSTKTVSNNNRNFFETKKPLPFFAAPIIQPKLTVNQPNDIYEQEADAVADKVMRMEDTAEPTAVLHTSQPITKIQRHCAACEEEKIQRKEDEEEVQLKPMNLGIQRKCAACKMEDDLVQKKSLNTGVIQRAENGDCKLEEQELPPATLKVNGVPLQRKGIQNIITVPNNVSSTIETSKGKGNQINKSVLLFMNTRFNKDFSDVKIHTNTDAVGMNKQLNAKAFTVQKNIYFNSGEYQPETFSGKKLLAHELTHVVQQTNVSPAKNHILLKPQDNVLPLAAPVTSSASVCDQFQAATVPAQATVQSPETQANTDLPATVTPSQVSLIAPTPQTAKIIGNNDSPSTPVATQPKNIVTKSAVPDDGAFKELLAEAKKHSTKQKDHVPSGKKTIQAVNAVTEGNNAVAVVDAISAGEKVIAAENAITPTKDEQKEFQVEEFKTGIKEKLKSAFLDTEKDPLPQNKKEAAKLVDNHEKLNDVTKDAQTGIKDAKDDFVGNADQITKPGPAPDGNYDNDIAMAPAIPYTPEQVGAKPVINDASRAIPKPLSDDEMQMDEDHNADSLDKAMSDHQVSDNQLAESDEPKFLDTLDTKQTSQKELCQVPQKLQQAQNLQQQGDNLSAAQTIMNNLSGMNNARKNQFGQVKDKQASVKDEGEQRLQEYYVDIQNIYTTTETNVKNSLDYLECTVTPMFQASIDSAFETFKSKITDRLDYYYDWHIVRDDYEKDDERTQLIYNYELSELISKRDDLPENDPERKSLNDEIEAKKKNRTKLIIEKIFDEEKQAFTDALDKTIDAIAIIVSTGLKNAKDMIQKGRLAMKKENDSLSDENKLKAQEATTDFSDKFTDLEGKVNDKEGDLQDGLVKQYSESVAKLKDTFETIRKEAALSWWQKAWRKIKDIVNTIIEIGKLLLNVLKKAANVIGDIISHPIRFFENLIEGVSLGFKNFVNNLPTHLEDIVFKLILGVMPPNLTLPDKWDAKGILSFVLGIFGLSKENIRAQAVLKFTEPVVAQLEQGFELFVIFKNEGFAGLWEYIKEKIGDLKNAIIDEIISFFKDEVIGAAVEFLLSALTPASGFIKVCKSIINVVQFFLKNLVNILKLFDSILDSFADIVAGRLKNASDRVESALEDILLIGIKFLASLVGINLDKIQSKISKIVDAVKGPVNRALQWFFTKAEEFAEKSGILGLIRKGKEKYNAGKAWVNDKVEKGKAWVKGKVGAALNKFVDWWTMKEEMTFDNGEEHELYFEGEGEDAVLMMKSTPKTYKEYIQKHLIVSKDDAKADEKKKAKADALDVANEIDRLIKSNKRTETTADDEGKNSEKDMTNEFKAALKKLADLTEKFSGIDDRQLPVSSAPEYGGPSSGGFGTSMHISKLTRLGPTGTTVSVKNPIMDVLLNRLEIKRSYYIGGHLLSKNLHGSGSTWENVAPLTQGANKEHEQEIESELKDALSGKSKRIFDYTVTANYDYERKGKTDLEVDKSSHTKKDKELIKKIITNEAKIPEYFSCTVHEIDFDGNPVTGAGSFNIDDYRVYNNIDDTSPDSYVV